MPRRKKPTAKQKSKALYEIDVRRKEILSNQQEFLEYLRTFNISTPYEDTRSTVTRLLDTINKNITELEKLSKEISVIMMLNLEISASEIAKIANTTHVTLNKYSNEMPQLSFRNWNQDDLKQLTMDRY